jgi:hypothetical protein
MHLFFFDRITTKNKFWQGPWLHLLSKRTFIVLGYTYPKGLAQTVFFSLRGKAYLQMKLQYTLTRNFGVKVYKFYLIGLISGS